MTHISSGTTPTDFYNNMDIFKKITWGKVNNVIKGISMTLFKQIIEDTPVEYGWLQNSWFFTLDSISSKTLPEYTEGDHPKKVVYDRTGEVKKRLTANEVKRSKALTKKGVAQHAYFFTNNAHTGHRIEYDHWSYNKKPNGMVRISIQKIANLDMQKYAFYTEGSEG